MIGLLPIIPQLGRGFGPLEVTGTPPPNYSGLTTLTAVEQWAVARLSALQVNGQPLFRTVAHWLGQVGLADGGVASFQRYAPFAFVSAEIGRLSREGDYDANLSLVLNVLIGAAAEPAGQWRIAADGIGAMFEAVFLELDGQHPGGALACNDFYLTDTAENITTDKFGGIQLIFAADWIPLKS